MSALLLVLALPFLFGLWRLRDLWLRVSACCRGTDLEPRPGPRLKVLVAYILVSLSRLVRPPKKHGKNPNWLDSRHRENSTSRNFNDSFYFWVSASTRHTTFDAPGGLDDVLDDALGATPPRTRTRSRARTRTGTGTVSASPRIVITTRLGFFGVGASSVAPWLMFDVDGVTFTLPPTMDAERDAAGAPPQAGAGESISARDAAGNELTYTCVEPLRRFRLEYHGELRVSRAAEVEAEGGAEGGVEGGAEGESVSVFADLDLDIRVVSSLFFYQESWDKMAVAKAMSAEPWSLRFFRSLRSEHQEHYEAGTSCTGTIDLRSRATGSKGEGKGGSKGKRGSGNRGGWEGRIEIEGAPGFRDHSFGKRDWTVMTRCGGNDGRERRRGWKGGERQTDRQRGGETERDRDRERPKLRYLFICTSVYALSSAALHRLLSSHPCTPRFAFTSLRSFRYLWLGTVSLETPLHIGGHEYTHVTGTAVQYGHTFKHLVAGGLVGRYCERGVRPAPPVPFGAMTHMKDIAPVWHDAEAKGLGRGVGHLVGTDLQFDIALCIPASTKTKEATKEATKDGARDTPYTVLRCTVKRDAWKHGFIMQGGTFEVRDGRYGREEMERG